MSHQSTPDLLSVSRLRLARRLLAVAIVLVSFVGIGSAASAEVPQNVGVWGAKDQFTSPTGIATDSDGFMYVANAEKHRIDRYDSDGVLVDQWGTEGNGPGQLEFPRGIAVDSDNFVYVADTKNHRIQKFTSAGTFVSSWGHFGQGQIEFDNPSGVAVDSKGFIFVLDTKNNRIQKLSPKGEYVTAWGGPGKADGEFDEPLGIAVDGSDRVLVSDSGNDRVQLFTGNGAFVSKWGKAGIGNGEFENPSGIAFGPSGEIYVTDQGNHRIQVFTSPGVYRDWWGSEGTGASQFSYPWSVAVDREGSIYVADWHNNRVTKFAYTPTVPVLNETLPASPGKVLNPRIKGKADVASVVSLFTNSTCSGDPVAVGQPGVFGQEGIPVVVGPGSSVTYWGKATSKFGLTSACSATSVTYTHSPDVDDPDPPTVPPAPINLHTNPGSPNASSTPEVAGNAQSETTIRIYSTADCSGLPVATGTSASFNAAGIPVQVPKGSSTTFRATATNGLNLTSACSESFVTYVQKDDPVVVDPCKENPEALGCKPPVADCVSDPTLVGCPFGPIPNPTVTTATFDGVNLHVRLRCPAKFKPKCVSRAVPVTARGFKKVRRGKRMVKVPSGKAMGQVKKVTTRSNKWVRVSFVIKPAFRAKVESMTRVDARPLIVRQRIRSKRIYRTKNRKLSTIFHNYKVRTQG